MQRPAAFFALVVASLGTAALADDKVDYLTAIKPIFAERCFACHGALKQESGLRLDTASLMRKGGDGGAAVVPGQSAESALLERISADDEFIRMPPEGKPLTAKQIAAIAAWIDQGAAGPADEQPEQDPLKHWSFQPLVRPAVPAVKNSATEPGSVNADWVRNPIDAFIAARHDQLDLTPAPPAERPELLRRVYLDLIGLPPTREQLHDFLADDSPDAYEKVVDRLLESPQHGERWGRHWMDVWRYSDWYGRRSVDDVRNSYPHIWRWRDWIIRSLNEDKGYDQMIREMLAADEIAAEDDETIAALGFIVRNWFSLNYDTWKQDLVEHTGKAFLGLRFNCAHCHDHKYDPILQEEYFQLRAFFEPLEIRHDRVPGGPALTKYTRYVPGSSASLKPIEAGLPRVYDHYFDEKTVMYQGGDPRNRLDHRPVEPGVPPFLGGPEIEVEQIKLPATAWYPDLKPFALDAETTPRTKAVETARAELDQAKQSLPQLAEQVQAAETQLAEAKQKLAAGQSGDAKAVVPRSTKEIGYWRFEGPDDAEGFLSDASGNGHTLRRVNGGDPPAAPFTLAGQKAGGRFFNPAPSNQQPNAQAARFEQTSSFAYLAADGSPDFHADQFTIEACVHFDVAAANFNRTIADLAGCWTLLHRGLDDKTFELRLILHNSQGEVRDVATASDGEKLILKAGHDYFVAVTLDENNINFFAKNLTEPGQLQTRTFPRNAGDNDFSQLAKPEAETPFKIGNSDGTGRVVGLIDEVRYARGAASAAEIAAVTVLSPEQELLAAVASAESKLSSAKQRLAAAEKSIPVGEVKLAAAQADLAAVEARIAAEKARHLGGPGNPDELAQAASQAERQAKLAAAKSQQAQAQQAIDAANGSAPPDAKALQKAQGELAAANKAVEAAEKALAEAKSDYAPLGPQYPAVSTGRRRALAEWISSEQNPLTARVAVNHIWMRHFGRPIVETVFDFGRSGKLPSHPELIDWLAAELMQPSVAPLPEQEPLTQPSPPGRGQRAGWSMKHIHRLIVTSNAYRMSSKIAADSPNLARDKDNLLWWRFDPQRMQAEVVRDSVLHVAGALEATIGGPELEPALEATTQRRSLYYAVYPEGGGIMKFMETFDPPDPIDCYRRKDSIVPQQALALSNSELAVHHGRLLARKLSAEIEQAGGDAAAQQAQFVTAAFEQVLTRPPTEKEREFCAEFIRKQLEVYGSADAAGQTGAPPKGVVAAAAEPQLRARESLVRVLLNHADFVTIR